MAPRRSFSLTILGGLLFAGGRISEAQSVRDSAVVIAAVGADLRQRFGETPLMIVFAVDNSGEGRLAEKKDYSFPLPSSEDAWAIRLLASAAHAGIADEKSFASIEGRSRPIPRLVTLGRVTWDGSSCYVLLRIETPPWGPRKATENTVWRYTIRRAVAGLPTVDARDLLFSAEILYPAG